MRINKFQEKPAKPESNLASMGIYIFDRSVLEDYLRADAKDEKSEHDFGKNVIPTMLADQVPLYAYPFEGYWKDVGTIDSLWQANMDLLADELPINLRDSNWRIYSGNQSFPPHLIGPKARPRVRSSPKVLKSSATSATPSFSTALPSRKGPRSPIRSSCLAQSLKKMPSSTRLS